MSDVQTLLTRCQQLGAELIPTPHGTLKVKSAAPLPEALREALKQRKGEVLAFLNEQGQTRAFLPRPLGQEDNPDVWDAWTPFMLWLLEHHRERYDYLCRTDRILTALEEEGETASERYKTVSQQLLAQFETARRLALEGQVKVWWQ